MIKNIFNVIGKKNNQTLVSNEDREISALGSTDNAGNSLPALIVFPRVEIFRFAPETDDRFYLYNLCRRTVSFALDTANCLRF